MVKRVKLVVALLFVWCCCTVVNGDAQVVMFISGNIFALDDGFVWESIDSKLPKDMITVDELAQISTNYEKEWEARLELDQYPIVPHQMINSDTGESLRIRLVGKTDFHKLKIRKGLLTKHCFELKEKGKTDIEELMMHHVELEDGRIFSALVGNSKEQKHWECDDRLILIQKDRNRHFLLNLDLVSLLDVDLVGRLHKKKLFDLVVEVRENSVVLDQLGECEVLHYQLLPYPSIWLRNDEVIVSMFGTFFDKSISSEVQIGFVQNITRNDLAFVSFKL